MGKTKTLSYDWELGHENLFLQVSFYSSNGNLYVGLHRKERGIAEAFGDLTVNLPFEPVRVNEAYIDEFSSKSKLEFIEKHKLGKVRPERGRFGDGEYYKVAFDLERLAEFDKKGVEKYRRLHHLSKGKGKNTMQKTDGRR